MERKKEYEPCLPGEYGSARTTEESLWKLATEMASRRADREEKRREELPRKKDLSQKGGLTAWEDLGREDSP